MTVHTRPGSPEDIQARLALASDVAAWIEAMRDKTGLNHLVSAPDGSPEANYAKSALVRARALQLILGETDDFIEKAFGDREEQDMGVLLLPAPQRVFEVVRLDWLRDAERVCAVEELGDLRFLAFPAFTHYAAQRLHPEADYRPPGIWAKRADVEAARSRYLELAQTQTFPSYNRAFLNFDGEVTEAAFFSMNTARLRMYFDWLKARPSLPGPKKEPPIAMH